MPTGKGTAKSHTSSDTRLDQTQEFGLCIWTNNLPVQKRAARPIHESTTAKSSYLLYLIYESPIYKPV